MEAIIYSNGNQECERAINLMRAVHSNVIVYHLGKHFEKHEFEMEFGGDAHYPQIAMGPRHIGGLKETLNYMSRKGMFV